MTPTHINPGTDTTINPVVIDDSKRERKPGWNRSNAKEDLEFLSWCADRFEFHYNEDGRNPHIVRLREIASHTPAHPPEVISKELALELCMDARKEAHQRVDAYEKFIKDISQLTICARKDGYEYRMIPEGYIQEMIALMQAGRK